MFDYFFLQIYDAIMPYIKATLTYNFKLSYLRNVSCPLRPYMFTLGFIIQQV